MLCYTLWQNLFSEVNVLTEFGPDAQKTVVCHSVFFLLLFIFLYIVCVCNFTYIKPLDQHMDFIEPLL
jgi:hypothetical protein